MVLSFSSDASGAGTSLRIQGLADQIDLTTNRILVWEQKAGQCAVDDGHRFPTVAVSLLKLATLKYVSPQGAEVAMPDSLLLNSYIRTHYLAVNPNHYTPLKVALSDRRSVGHADRSDLRQPRNRMHGVLSELNLSLNAPGHARRKTDREHGGGRTVVTEQRHITPEHGLMGHQQLQNEALRCGKRRHPGSHPESRHPWSRLRCGT